MWKKILLALIALGVIGVTLGMWATSPLADTARGFFSALHNKDYQGAYNQYILKDKLSFDKFKQFVLQTHLDSVKDEKWHNRYVNADGTGKMDGELIFDNGKTMPIVLYFVKVNEEWKIAKISNKADDLALRGSSGNPQSAKVPTKDEAIALVTETVRVFTNDLKRGDMSNFYNYISNTWQKQTSVEELNKFFKVLGSQGIDFSLLNNQTPMIEEEPTIKSNGALEIKSLYNGQPLGLKVNVEIILDYVSEFGEWKLLAIDIHPKQG